MGKFPDSVVEAAWKRSGSRCECTRDHSWHKGRCSQSLTWGHRGDDAKSTGWEAHHKTSQAAGGKPILSNCEILCIKCHKETGSYGG